MNLNSTFQFCVKFTDNAQIARSQGTEDAESRASPPGSCGVNSARNGTPPSRIPTRQLSPSTGPNFPSKSSTPLVRRSTGDCGENRLSVRLMRSSLRECPRRIVVLSTRSLPQSATPSTRQPHSNSSRHSSTRSARSNPPTRSLQRKIPLKIRPSPSVFSETSATNGMSASSLRSRDWPLLARRGDCFSSAPRRKG